MSNISLKLLFGNKFAYIIGMNLYNERYNRAKEEINKALIQEYIKKHPGVREQDVIVMNQNGKLIFSDLSTVLAEMKVRKNFEESIQSTEKMAASLSVQENQRWKDATDSATQSKLMIDCLNSSPFNKLTREQWSKEHNFIRKHEAACAKATVKIEALKQEIVKIRKEGVSIQSSRGRTAVILYLQWVIYQLKSLHQLLKKELEFSELFHDCSSQFLRINYEAIQQVSEPFNILNKIYKAAVGDRKVTLMPNDVSELNRRMLVETKKTLTSAVDKLKKQVEAKRKEFHVIWASIITLQENVKDLEELNRNAENSAFLQNQERTPPQEKNEPEIETESNRMARYLNERK